MTIHMPAFRPKRATHVVAFSADVKGPNEQIEGVFGIYIPTSPFPSDDLRQSAKHLLGGDHRLALSVTRRFDVCYRRAMLSNTISL